MLMRDGIDVDAMHVYQWGFGIWREMVRDRLQAMVKDLRVPETTLQAV